MTEAQTNRYKVDSVDSTGEIIKDDIKNVLFTNTKYPDLSLSKIVIGKNGDKTKPFTFTIQLKDETGYFVFVNKTFFISSFIISPVLSTESTLYRFVCASVTSY